MVLEFSSPLRYQACMAQESIESLARKLAESLPQGLKTMRDELEQNFRSVLSSGLGKLDLVSREEFDVQQAVLARTRQKLEALEKRLDAMEQPPAQAAAAKKKKKKKPQPGKNKSGSRTTK